MIRHNAPSEPDFTDRVMRGEPIVPAKITENAAGHTLVDGGAIQARLGRTP